MSEEKEESTDSSTVLVSLQLLQECRSYLIEQNSVVESLKVQLETVSLERKLLYDQLLLLGVQPCTLLREASPSMMVAGLKPETPSVSDIIEETSFSSDFRLDVESRDTVGLENIPPVAAKAASDVLHSDVSRVKALSSSSEDFTRDRRSSRSRPHSSIDHEPRDDPKVVMTPIQKSASVDLGFVGPPSTALTNSASQPVLRLSFVLSGDQAQTADGSSIGSDSVDDIDLQQVLSNHAVTRVSHPNSPLTSNQQDRRSGEYSAELDGVPLDGPQPDHVILTEVDPSSRLYANVSRHPSMMPLRDLITRVGINLFNRTPRLGINYLTDHGVVAENPEAIASFLLDTRNLSKIMVGEYLGVFSDFCVEVLHCVLGRLSLKGHSVLECLRLVHHHFQLRGEAQKIDKFLDIFSQHYVKQNPGSLGGDPKLISVLSFAAMLLNTDLHNPQNKNKMTQEQFVKNLGVVIQEYKTESTETEISNTLESMYQDIRNNEICVGKDNTSELRGIETLFMKKPAGLITTFRQFEGMFQANRVKDVNKRSNRSSRMIYLFNDLVLVAKSHFKSSHDGRGHYITMKEAFPLCEFSVGLFDKEPDYGVSFQLRGKRSSTLFLVLSDKRDRDVLISKLEMCIDESLEVARILGSPSSSSKLSPVNTRRLHSQSTLVMSESIQVVPKTPSLDHTRECSEGGALNPNQHESANMDSLELRNNMAMLPT